MEENVSPELSLAPEPEQSQDPMDSCSQEGKEQFQLQDENVAKEKLEVPDISPKARGEVKKTWGFRQTTIAKREMPGEAAADTQENRCPVRRSGRQSKRTDKLEEFLSTTKRASRKSAPPTLESSDPPSQTPTDAETASEASFDGNTDTKALDDKVESPERRTRSGTRKQTVGKTRGARQTREGGGRTVKDEGSSDNDEDGKDEDESKEKPPTAFAKRGPVRTYTNKKKAANKNITPVSKAPLPVNKVITPVKRETKPKGIQPAAKPGTSQTDEENEDENDSSTSSSSSSIESDDGGYDPNALYCICRQKHNKRFMICCDRCEEWFHGDCVGITEARGRLMERNGEDYICPNCTAKKNKVVRPATAALSAGTELGKLKADAAAAAYAKTGDDLGIKGRIEKATNPTGKKKIKIFQPVAEESNLPKCIGPGCENNAQPDSVYCGNDCILRHAAVAMKSKERAKAQKTKSTPKVTPNRKSVEEESDSEEEHDPDLDDDEEDEHAEEHPPPPAAASWSSDHNYNAVTPEKTTPISPTVLNKKCMYLFEGFDTSVLTITPSKTPVKVNKKSPATKGTKTTPKGKKPSPQVTSSKFSKKLTTPPSKTAAKSKKPAPSSAPAPSPFPPGPVHITGALRVTKSTFTIPKKQPQQKDTQSHSQTSSSSRVPSSPVSSSPSNHSSSSRPPQPAASAPSMSPMPPPNNQMRQNIRRSLTDILYKRVSDSDDLNMTESEVGRLAVAIEKEMFNLCLNTDSKYKNKYRSLMFNLKDPKNKGLFYRVIGGEVSPFRLVRLSAEELLSKEISEWRKADPPESLSTHSGQSKLGSRRESGPHNMDVEDAPPTSDADVCISTTSPSSRMASAADQDETTPSVSAQVSAVEGNSGSSMPDIFNTMLKDTTAEHRTHLFDLNCKICTGQKTEDEPAAKKAKLMKKPDTKPPRQELRSSRSSSGDVPPAYQQQVPQGYHMEAPVSDSQPQLYQEDPSSMVPPAQVPAPVTNPTVSSVSITRRDPRMARHGSGVSVTHAAPETPTVMPISAEPPSISVAAPVEVGPKGPLPMPPAPPPSMTVTSEPPPEGETAIFLHGQEKIWKGFINMQSVAKFVTKAYLVSGSFEYLKEDLPDTIHVGGRISPSTVWDYVGKLKTSLSKELCLIRFHPATEEEEVAYVSLFSYFSSRKRFGVVANNNRRIKDLYLIPLSSKDPLPSKLLPFDGPGLEPARPNLLLGLLICQKDRKRAGAPLEVEEKRSKTQTKDTDDTGLPKPSASIKTEKSVRPSQEIPFSTTPPGSPPSLSSSETPSSSSSVTSSSVLSFLSGYSPSSSGSVASSAPTATPLQTILNTLFGKKKHDSEASNSPSEHSVEASAPPPTMLDPIVQQFGQISKEKVDEDEDDRPYDPEEEYDPSRGYNVPKKPVDMVSEPEVSKQREETPNEVDDVAYDPEDDSIFDEVKPVVPGQAKGTAECIAEPQKILEDMKQIGDQKWQKQGEQVQQQMSSVVTSATSFSVTDTLITQPAKSLLANSQLLQLGKKVEELVKSSSVAPLINQRRDPRQSRDPRQAAASRKLTDEPEEKEEIPDALADTTPSSQPAFKKTELAEVVEPEHRKSSEEPETQQPQDEVKSETLPFMDSDKAEVSIPLLGEQMEPDMEVNFMEEEVKNEEAETPEAETDIDKYSIWPNAASILKTGDDSKYEQNSQDSDSSSFFIASTNTSTVTSAIPVLTQSTMGDTHSHHMPHMSSSGFQNEYRPPADVPPPSNFPPPHPMQGSNLIIRPPPMSMPPPMQGPPMSGPPPMQGPPPPIHVPPPIRGPPPMQNDGSQQYGPPPGSYPPYQNQWGGTQPQQQPPPGPPPQNIMPPRGPPPPFPPVGQRGPPPQMFDPSMPPQHIGQQGPPTGLPPPPSFDGQNSLPPPRFSGGPPPPFQFPGSRGPPPPFTGPPPGHFDNRLPPPSHFPGPRGPPPSQYGDHGSQPPMVEPPRGPVDQYNKDNANSFKIGVDQQQNQNPAHMYKENQGPPPGSAYRGPLPNQYEDRRGPPSSGEMGGQHFHPHNQYGGSRPHSSPPHRGTFDEHRGLPSQDNRAPQPQHFGGSERYRFDRHSEDGRPVRHSGPLLPTPSEGPIPPPGRMGAHSPDLHREDHWRRHSPDMRRRSSSTREESEPRGDRLSRFEGGHREPPPGPSHLSEERQRELSEDRRRDREREGPHSGRPSWDRAQGKRWSREREWDRGRERDRDRERSRERDRSRGREGERHRETEGERHRDPEADKRRDRDRDKDRERDRDRGRDRDRDRDSDRRDYDRDRGRIRDRDRERERDRERDRRRSRDRDRGKDRGRDRDRERDRDRDKDRDRRERSRSRERKEDKKESKHDVPKDSDKLAETENDKNMS
uniref:Death inducer-obliterator 1 n=1 Tax=Myripristis murdjan TaxID=586833 RepID=A0A667ZM08_9TELE